MRARLLFVLALLGVLVGATALPANASAQIIEPTPDVSTNKFINGAICVGSTLNPAYYPVGAIAQQWNDATYPGYGTRDITLDFSTNCAGDGYTPSHRTTIGTFSNASYNGCLYFTNTATIPSQAGDSYMNWWTQGPGIYINTGISGCVSTAFRRSHQVAAAIGYALGLNIMTSSGYASRVQCTCSLDTLRAPTFYDAAKANQIYGGSFGD
jgi:hypothetical protein